MADPPKRIRRPLRPGPEARQNAGRPVDARELRRLFQVEAIEQREANGELTAKVTYSKHVDPPLEFEPLCTHSRRKAFFNLNRKKVAEVHYYERPDGSIGASGSLDPKEIVHQGVLYFLDRQ
jgi:hypothetical protein